jgi:hypothetical protein
MSLRAKRSNLIKKKCIFSYEIAALPMVARNDIIPSPWNKLKLKIGFEGRSGLDPIFKMLKIEP